MNSLTIILLAVSAVALDVCIIALILTAYREKKNASRRWSKISGNFELVEPGITYPLECDEIIIGRHASADIRIPDMSVSRYHALLTVTNGVWTITDIGSKSGVYVNGNTVCPVFISGNRIGKRTAAKFDFHDLLLEESYLCACGTRYTLRVRYINAIYASHAIYKHTASLWSREGDHRNDGGGIEVSLLTNSIFYNSV